MKTPVNRKAAKRRLRKALVRRKFIGKSANAIRNQKRKPTDPRYAGLLSAVFELVGKKSRRSPGRASKS